MASILLFLGGLAIIGAWWLSKQGLTSKPWLEQGIIGEMPLAHAVSPPPAKVGLGVFLAVAGSLFALVISAYAMRMQMPDWRAVPLPRILWLNTGTLILSSLALHEAQSAARKGEPDALKMGLLAGGVAASAFLSGQLLAWRQLVDAGYLLATNPANTFFYVMTGAHGLHLLGGLAVLGRTGERAWRGIAPERLRLPVELCAIYWHFLLAVWLIVLGVLTGWAGDFAAICQQLLT